MKSLSSYKNKMIIGGIISFFLLMFLFPYASFQGASSGLLLWFLNVFPILLPFIIVSNLMIKLNIASQISHFLYPVFGRLLGLSKDGCYPLLVGFLSGIPMGAKTSADLVINKKIKHHEGNFLLSLCNNASPTFIMNFIAINQLKLPRIRLPLFVIVYSSTIISALLCRFFYNIYCLHIIQPKMQTQQLSEEESTSKFDFHLMDSSIMNGFEIVTKIGGYIILFSILAQILKELGTESSYIKPVLMSLLEITTGINQISVAPFDINTKIVLASILTSFGGLSGIAQTKSVLGDSRLSIKYYIIVKLLCAFIAFILSSFYVTMILS